MGAVLKEFYEVISTSYSFYCVFKNCVILVLSLAGLAPASLFYTLNFFICLNHLNMKVIFSL